MSYCCSTCRHLDELDALYPLLEVGSLMGWGYLADLLKTERNSPETLRRECVWNEGRMAFEAGEPKSTKGHYGTPTDVKLWESGWDRAKWESER